MMSVASSVGKAMQADLRQHQYVLKPSEFAIWLPAKRCCPMETRHFRRTSECRNLGLIASNHHRSARLSSESAPLTRQSRCARRQPADHSKQSMASGRGFILQ